MKTPGQLRALFYNSKNKNASQIVKAIRHLCDLQESYLEVNRILSSSICRQINDLISKL